MEDQSEIYDEFREWLKIDQKTGNITLKKDIPQSFLKKFIFSVTASDSADQPKTTTTQVTIIFNTLILNTAGQIDSSKIPSMIPIVGYPILNKYMHYVVLSDAFPAGSVVATVETYKSLDNENFIYQFVENENQVGLDCSNQTRTNIDKNEQDRKVLEIFQISLTSGVISTKTSLKNILKNYVERFKMKVLVTSTKYSSTSLRVKVVVDVVPYVNPYPVFAKIFTGSVIENSLAGSYVLTIRTSHDQENKRRNSNNKNQLECSDISSLPPTSTKYFLLENPENAFSIEQNTGILTLAKNIEKIKNGDEKVLKEYILKVAARKSGFNAETYVSVDVVKSQIEKYRFEECKITGFESLNTKFGSSKYKKEEGPKSKIADGYIEKKDASNVQQFVKNSAKFNLNLSKVYIKKNSENIYIGSLKKQNNTCLKHRMTPRHKFNESKCLAGVYGHEADSNDKRTQSVIEVLYGMISADQLNGNVVLNMKEEQKNFILRVLNSTIKPSESLTLYFSSWCVSQCSQISDVEINIINKDVEKIQFLKSKFEFFVSFDAQVGTYIGETTTLIHPYSLQLAREVSYGFLDIDNRRTSLASDNFILIGDKMIFLNTKNLRPFYSFRIQALLIDQFNSAQATCSVNIYIMSLKTSCYFNVYFLKEDYNLVVNELPPSNHLTSIDVAVNASSNMEKVFMGLINQQIQYYLFEINKTTDENNYSTFHSSDDIIAIDTKSGMVTISNLEKFVKQKRLFYLVTAAFEPNLELFLINETNSRKNEKINYDFKNHYSPLYSYAQKELKIEVKLSKPVLIFSQNDYSLSLNLSSEVMLEVKAYVYDDDGDGVEGKFEYYLSNETRFTNDEDLLDDNTNLFIINKQTGLVTRNSEVEASTFKQLDRVSYVLSAVAMYKSKRFRSFTWFYYYLT